MGSTTYNIDRILDRVPNYGREEILSVMNEVQTMVYNTDGEQTLKIDSSTGMPPYLETTQGVYQYDCPSDCRRTAQIFTESWPYPYSRTRPSTPSKEYYFRHRNYYEVKVHSRDALPSASQLATVTFYVDPGTTTDKYYHLYYEIPTALTDETNNQIQIPDHIHFRFRSVCIAMLSSEEYGNIDMYERVIEKEIKKIRSELNAGAQTTMNQTPWQSENLNYPESWWGYRQ